MKVPDHWWDGCTGYKLYEGIIATVNFAEHGDCCFQLEIDEERGALYPMRYDAVLHYADEEHSRFSSFHLPANPPSNPANESIRVRRRPRRIFDDFNNRSDNECEDVSDRETASCTSPDEEEDDNDSEEEDYEIYRLTDKNDWRKVGGRTRARNVAPIPFTGDKEEFTVKISDEELEDLRDDSGDIRFYKVFQWLLPKYDDQSFWEFLAARMRNYMIHLMRSDGYKPRYYSPGPGKNRVITADHVARFFGCHMGRMLRGFPSIGGTWCTRDTIFAVPPVKESMTQDAYKDIYRCMHFSDDWDEEEDIAWDDVYADNKYEPSPDAAKHRKKFDHIEEGFNKRWKECITFGKWVTADESRVAGWYHSCMTIGPEPKPIRTGATIHSLCITYGPLASYKVHCRVYGGKSDEDLNHKHCNTANTQKWVNLYDELLDAFKGAGHCVTMDSAYMGDIMAQIGRDEWLVNMVGTAQSNRTGADVASDKAAMKVGTYESAMFQHKTKPLVYAMW